MGNQAIEAEQIETATKPWKLVTHQYPDTDAWACLWVASRLVVPKNAMSHIVFARAGEQLSPEETEGFEVLYMDTGRSDCDQHERELIRGSSFQLVVQKYGLADDPGIVPILELTRATDNVEAVSPTSIHYYFKGLPQMLRDRQTGEVNWEYACERVFEVLDIVYGQASQKAQAIAEFNREGRIIKLPNRIWYSSLWWKPHLREAAYDLGVDVAMWTAGKGKNLFDVGIQINRGSPVELGTVMRALRLAEAQKRGITLENPAGAGHIGTHPLIPGWFLHDSRKLIVCGSRSHRLERHERTQLTPAEITSILRAELAKLPILRRS